MPRVSALDACWGGDAGPHPSRVTWLEQLLATDLALNTDSDTGRLSCCGLELRV